MQAFALAIDTAFVGKVAQHALERSAIGILGAERARDLSNAHCAAMLADKGDKFVP
jgi:hypothetical protein